MVLCLQRDGGLTGVFCHCERSEAISIVVKEGYFPVKADSLQVASEIASLQNTAQSSPSAHHNDSPFYRKAVGRQ